MWLSRTRVYSAIATSASGRRRRQTDVIKLLYGKKWDKLAAQPTSTVRPTLTHTIDQTPQHHLYSAVRHAVAMKEVNRETVHELLQRQRRLRRWDRSEIIVQALHDAQVQFTSQDYVILMAHANDSNNTSEAMKYWQHAVHANKVNPQVHSALLATYRNAGNWQAALHHCHEMWEDKIILDTFGLHATMNGCRRHGAWQEAINIFHEAVKHGTRPNAVVYLELLRSFEAATEMPLRWKYGEAILNALHVHNHNLQAQTQSFQSTSITNTNNVNNTDSNSKEVIELTAGHYNAVMSMFIHSPQWERGVELFNQMQKYNIQPSKDTLTTLLKLHEHDLSHCIRCVALAHQLSMPVTEQMYIALLRNLFARRLDHEAAAFIRKELQTDTQQTGNPLTVSLTLGLALLDTLLIHPCGQDALIFYESFEEIINSVLAGSTRHLVSIGDRSQRWLIHGRVAVVDHTVLLSTLFESLLQHYDSVFISCTSIRLILRRVIEDKKSMWSVNALQSLLRLSRLLPSPAWQMVRVLPYTHQLQAHTYLESTLPVDTHALEELRHEASSTHTKANLLNNNISNIGEADGSAEATSSWEQRLLDRFENVKNNNISSSGSNDKVKPASIVIRSHNTITAMLSESKKEHFTTHSISQVNHHIHNNDEDVSIVSTHANIPSPVQQSSVKQFSDRITSIESVLAVAAMLKTLNSDAADVHLVSRSAKQLSCVAKWNKLHPLHPLRGVHYPNELLTKAPPASMPK